MWIFQLLTCDAPIPRLRIADISIIGATFVLVVKTLALVKLFFMSTPFFLNGIYLQANIKI